MAQQNSLNASIRAVIARRMEERRRTNETAQAEAARIEPEPTPAAQETTPAPSSAERPPATGEVTPTPAAGATAYSPSAQKTPEGVTRGEGTPDVSGSGDVQVTPADGGASTRFLEDLRATEASPVHPSHPPKRRGSSEAAGSSQLSGAPHKKQRTVASGEVLINILDEEETTEKETGDSLRPRRRALELTSTPPIEPE